MKIQAELSLYPLKEPNISPYLDIFLEVLKGAGLTVQVGPMSTIISGERNKVFQALSDAFGKTADKCQAVLSVRISNACPCISQNQN